MSNYKNLADLVKVCSVLPIFAVMPAMAETINIGIGETQTLTGKHTDTIVNEGSVYFLESEDKEQLAVLNIENAIISNATTNYANSQAGYVKGSDNSKIVVKNSEFSDNKSDWYSAIWAASPSGDNAGGILEISDSRFLRNEANDGAAVGAMWKTNISNTLFEGNKATDVTGDGGVLFLGAVSQSMLTDVVFKNNTSAADGGAISMRAVDEGNNSAAKLDILDSEFSRNSAANNGGAIFSTFYDSENAKDSVYIQDTDFTANSANNGGAIYTEGKADLGGGLASMKIEGAKFTENISSSMGGAIYNGSTVEISDSLFRANKSDYVGGAMFLAKGADTTIKNSEFDANMAEFGGAIYTSTGIKNVDISDSAFTNNVALGAGAVGIFNKGTLTNVQFSGNKATDATEDGGGAVFLGSLAQVQMTNATFSGNTSASVGGGVAMRAASEGNNTDAKLDIVDSVFSGNTAGTQGGAIFSTFYNSESAVDNVYVKNTQFVNNAAAEGGAIYNEGLADCGGNFAAMKLENVSFVDNVATINGGAIYNGVDGTVNLSGNNTFSGNIAGVYGALNDIYNLGTLNIIDGTTAFGGGVSGNGTFTLAEGATLNIGTALIQQGTIDLDGAIVASAMNTTSFGRFVGDVTVGDNATLDLTVGSVGTYDIFAGKTIDVSKVTVGDTYLVESGTDGIVITTKAIEDIAADTGLTTQAAGLVSGLANSTDKNVQKISLAAQQLLNSGDVETVEKEVAKANPDGKPVVQSVATSVQNQVLAVAAGRMSGSAPVMGRSGGDEAKSNGFWAQGLFNKSKYENQFHGYTRGFALGADTMINSAFTVGAGFAYNNSDIHTTGRGHTDIDANTLFLYGQYKPTNWFVNGTLAYTMAEYTEDTKMFGNSLVATYDVDSYGAQIMTGYDFATGITTEVGARYLHIAQDSYSNGLTSVDSMDSDFLTGVAGMKYAFTIENDWAVKLRPELRAAVTYDFVSDGDEAVVTMPGVASYKVAGERLKRLGGEFGIGLTALYNGMEITAMYDLDLHEDYTSHTGMIKFRTQF